MRRDKLAKLYPMLRIIAKLSDEDRHVLVHYLNQTACEGIYECVQNSLRNKTIPDEVRKDLQTYYMPKKQQLRRLYEVPNISKDDSREKRAEAMARFARRRKKSLQAISDDLGPIMATARPLIKRYAKVEDSSSSDGEDNEDNLDCNMDRDNATAVVANKT